MPEETKTDQKPEEIEPLSQKPAGQEGEKKPDEKLSETDTKKDEADPLKLAGQQAPDLDSMDLEQLYTHAGFTPERRTAAAKHFKEHGKLSDEDYADLKTKAKIPKAIVNRQMQLEMAEASRGHQSRQDAANAAVAEAKKIAGGDEQYGVVLDWARSNVDQSRLERFDKMVKSDPSMHVEVVRILNAEYAAKHGGSRNGSGMTPSPTTTRPKNKTEYSSLMSRVVAGDKAAEKILDGMDLSDIMKLPAE